MPPESGIWGRSPMLMRIMGHRTDRDLLTRALALLSDEAQLGPDPDRQSPREAWLSEVRDWLNAPPEQNQTAQSPDEKHIENENCRYQALFEHASDSIFVIDKQGNYLDVNPAACTLLGYSRDELLSMNHRQLVSKDGLAQTPKPFSNTRPGEVAIFERDLRAKSGVLVPVELSATQLPDGRVYGRARDISKAQNQRHQVSNLRSMLQALRRIDQFITKNTKPQDLIAEICDALVEERHWPAAWAILTDVAGRPLLWQERGLGPSVDEAVNQFRQEGLLPCMQQVSQQKTARFFSRSECSYCPVAKAHPQHSSIVAQIHHEGRTYGYLCGAPGADFVVSGDELEVFSEIALDLGFALRAEEIRLERSHAIERLHQEMAKTQQYLNLAPVILMAIDQRGKIDLINRSGCEILGRQEFEILGQPLENFIPTSQHQELSAHMQGLVGGQQTAHDHFDLDVIQPRGGLRNIAWRGTVRSDEFGQIQGYFFAGLDVTDTRRAELQLAQSDRMATVGMLAAGVAHEINNPLTYVLYNLEEVANRIPVFIEQIAQLSDPAKLQVPQQKGPLATRKLLDPAELNDCAECVRDAKSGAERVRDIVRDLKIFSRVDEEKVGPVDLAQAVESAISLAYNEIKYRAQLLRDLRPTPMVEAHEGRLSQVVLNLLINAAQAIDEGAVLNHSIQVKTWSEDNQACLAVIDSGKGIAPEHLEKIFDPFFTTKPKGIGSGLGLSICRSIIEGYNGSVQCFSEPNKGTRFEIRLPRMRITVDDVSDEVEEGSEPKQAGARILVIDDDPLLRALVARTLAKHHQVLTAASGAEALDIIADDTDFDVILCDIMMPEVTGIDLYHHLSETHPLLQQRILFMTGGVFTSKAKEFLANSSQEYIEKPFEIKALRIFIDTFLQHNPRLR